MTNTTTRLGRLDKVEAALAPPTEEDLDAMIAEVAFVYGLLAERVRALAAAATADADADAAPVPAGGLDIHRVAAEVAAEFGLPVETVLAQAEELMQEVKQRERQWRARGRRR